MTNIIIGSTIHSIFYAECLFRRVLLRKEERFGDLKVRLRADRGSREWANIRRAAGPASFTAASRLPRMLRPPPDWVVPIVADFIRESASLCIPA